MSHEASQVPPFNIVTLNPELLLQRDVSHQNVKRRNIWQHWFVWQHEHNCIHLETLLWNPTIDFDKIWQFCLEILLFLFKGFVFSLSAWTYYSTMWTCLNCTFKLELQSDLQYSKKKSLLPLVSGRFFYTMHIVSIFFCKQCIQRNAAVVFYCAVIITTHERLPSTYKTSLNVFSLTNSVHDECKELFPKVLILNLIVKKHDFWELH